MTGAYDYDDLVDETRQLLAGADGRAISDEEISEASGVEVTSVRAMLDAEDGGTFTIRREGDTRVVVCEG